MRFFVEIAFDGSEFHGWQVQPNTNTVQGIINHWLSTILQQDIHVVGCGRTDAGVHANQFYFHFDCEKNPPSELLYKLNSVLPDTIAVKRILPCKPSNHSRFSAVERTYHYYTHFTKNPFLRHYSYYCTYQELDIEKMKKVASMLTNYTDFSPLSKYNEDNRTTLCKLTQSLLRYDENQQTMELKVSANRFLHNMIRRIMGLLISVGRRKINIDEVADVMSTSSEFSINFVAPPEGLFLTGIQYPFIND